MRFSAREGRGVFADGGAFAAASVAWRNVVSATVGGVVSAPWSGGGSGFVDEALGTRFLLGRAHQQDPVCSIDLLELDLDPLAARGWEVLAHVVGPDRQLAVAAVDENGELNASGPAVLEERFDRSADRA